MSVEVIRNNGIATLLLNRPDKLMENLSVCGARLTQDHKEGIAAFKERRPAKFTGR
jgi:enoyl-CoA hydratase/carnithine racemase